MRMRHPIIPGHAPPDPVWFFCSGSDDTIKSVSYIVCLHGRVPKRYELWSLNASGVRKVHPFARVRLLDNFREDTFQNFFFNSWRCRIPFIGWRLLNSRVEFIRFSDVTLDAEVVIYTPNIFFQEWDTYPTMIYPTVSNFTWQAYVTITTQKGFVLRCNHESQEETYRSW